MNLCKDSVGLVFDYISKEKRNIEVTCSCGGVYNTNNKSRHEHTNMHIKFITIVNILKKKNLCNDCVGLVFAYISKDELSSGKSFPVKYWDYDEKDTKEIKLTYSKIRQLQWLKTHDCYTKYTIFGALKLMKLI